MSRENQAEHDESLQSTNGLYFNFKWTAWPTISGKEEIFLIYFCGNRTRILLTIKLGNVFSYVIKLCSANSVKSFTFIHIVQIMNISLCLIFHNVATNLFIDAWPLYGITDEENTIHSETVMRPCVTLLLSFMTSVRQAVVTKVAFYFSFRSVEYDQACTRWPRVRTANRQPDHARWEGSGIVLYCGSPRKIQGKRHKPSDTFDTRVTCGFVTRYKFLVHVHFQEQIYNKGTKPCYRTMAT